jgi:hypothetical protein
MRGLVLCAVLAVAPGCVAAAAAGAGAGGGIYLSSRGVSSTLAGPVDAAAARAQSVLTAEGVTITDTASRSGGDKRSIKGTKGELTIAVELEREGPSNTRAEVTARRNVVEWDQDYARRLMELIVRG